MRRAPSGSVIAERTRIRAPQSGQRRASTSKTRWRRSAQAVRRASWRRRESLAPASPSALGARGHRLDRQRRGSRPVVGADRTRRFQWRCTGPPRLLETRGRPRPARSIDTQLNSFGAIHRPPGDDDLISPFLESPRHDPIPRARARREHTVISHLMGPRWRHQRREPLEQLRALHHDVRRPVPPWRLEPIGNPTITQLFEPLQRERRTCHIATQPFESAPVPCGNSHVGMKAHPAVPDATWRNPSVGLDAVLLTLVRVRIDPISESPPRLARFRPRRDPRADRGRREHRQERLVLSQTIFTFLDPQVLEPSSDPAGRPGQDADHVVGLGWVERVEATRHARTPFVHPVEHERMEMRRQVEGRAEALDERD